MIKTRNLYATSEPIMVTSNDTIEVPITFSIQNLSNSKDIYIGNSNVSEENFGIKLLPGAVWSGDLRPYDQLFAIGDGPLSVLMVDR